MSSIKYRANNKEKVKEANRKYFLKTRVEHTLSAAKTRAKNKGIPFSITKEDLLFPEYCPVFGIKLERGSGGKQDNSPAVDRFIPELGYVPGNVHIISEKANRIKNTAISSFEIFQVYLWMKEVEKSKNLLSCSAKGS